MELGIAAVRGHPTLKKLIRPYNKEDVSFGVLGKNVSQIFHHPFVAVFSALLQSYYLTVFLPGQTSLLRSVQFAIVPTLISLQLDRFLN